MPPKRTNSGNAGRSSARNSPRPVAQPLEDGRQQPLPDDVVGQIGSGRRCRRFGDRFGDRRDDAASRGRSPRRPACSVDLDAVAERLQRRLLEDDLVAVREVLGGGQQVDQAPGEDVDPLHVRVADEEAPRRADGHRDLHRQPHPGAAGRDDLLQPLLHRLLHRQRAGGGARAVVAVDPAGDRVAAEVDDVAAVAVQVLDQRVEDAVEVGGQLLGAALGPSSFASASVSGVKPEMSANSAAPRTRSGISTPGRERAPPIARDVGFRPVERVVPPGLRPACRVRFVLDHSSTVDGARAPCRASSSKPPVQGRAARWARARPGIAAARTAGRRPCRGRAAILPEGRIAARAARRQITREYRARSCASRR